MTALAGRRILVTGGSSGLGAALAAACADAGAHVAIVARGRDRLDEVAGATGALAVVADVGDAEAAQGAVAEAAKRLGGLDVLVNNAGLMLHSPGFVEDWDRSYRANVLGMLHVTHAALPHLRASGNADLVVVASTATDRVTAPDFGVYASTKAAQGRLTEALRLELADAPHVRVTLVKPGFMNTPGLGTGTRDPDLQARVVEQKQAIGLPPERVAAVIRQLLELPAEVSVPEITIVPTPRAA